MDATTAPPPTTASLCPTTIATPYPHSFKKKPRWRLSCFNKKNVAPQKCRLLLTTFFLNLGKQGAHTINLPHANKEVVRRSHPNHGPNIISVRPSHGRAPKITFGPWLGLDLLAPFPWSGRTLTVLPLSKVFKKAAGRRWYGGESEQKKIHAFYGGEAVGAMEVGCHEEEEGEVICWKCSVV